MAAPQKEHGHVQIANEIVEALMQSKLSGREFCIVLTVIRQSYGWNRRSAHISYNQLATLTGIDRRHVWKLVSDLAEKKVLVKVGTDPSTELAFQKDYEQWAGVTKNGAAAKYGADTENGATCSTEYGAIGSTEKGSSDTQLTLVFSASDDTLNTVKDSIKTPPQAKKTPGGGRDSPLDSSEERLLKQCRREPDKDWNRFLLAFYDHEGRMPLWATGRGSKKQLAAFGAALDKVGDPDLLFRAWEMFLDSADKWVVEGGKQAVQFVDQRLDSCVAKARGEQGAVERSGKTRPCSCGAVLKAGLETCPNCGRKVA